VIDKELKIPFYAKTTIILLGSIALTTVLYIAQGIIIPLVFALLFAILLNPIVSFFVRLKINRIVSIVFTMILTILVVSGVVGLMFSQANQFSDSWPKLVDRFSAILNQSITQTSGYFDINPQNIHDWIAKSKSELINNGGAAIGQTLINVGNGIAILFLVPIYVFIILYYKSLLLEFIHRVFSTGNQNQVNQIVSQTKRLIQRYLVGLVIEAILVATLNSAALLLLGIQYAIVLGIIGALLNVIPYVGGIVGVALPMMVALATKSTGWYAIYVMLAYYLIQLIDNNYIVPIIVASKVKINALFSIIAVFVGNALWGVSGMFLSIPLLAIIKLICDNIDSLKPWGFLFGDTLPNTARLKPSLKNKSL
jgi:predicted PurR-regulated permease PerM